MQAAQRAQAAAQGVVDARREKERKREEKELKKLAKAHGVKIAAPAATNAAASSSTAPVIQEEKPKAGGGWAAVATPAAPAPPRWNTASAPVAQPAPAFQTGGWSSLDDPATQAHGPAAASHVPQPDGGMSARTPQPSSTDPSISIHSSERSGVFNNGPAPGPASGTFSASGNTGGFRSMAAPAPSTTASSAREALSTAGQSLPAPSNSVSNIVPAASGPVLVPLDAPVKKTGSGKKKAKKEEAAMREQSRSGWQSFQRGGKR